MSLPEAAASSSVEVMTFGCRLNIVESEQMRAAADAAGETDLVIVNTCAVTADASRQAAQAIRRLKRERPTRRIVATGCAVEVERGRFSGMPEISRILPNSQKLRSDAWSSDGALRPQRPPALDLAHTRAFVDVQNGCDHRCTFCVIPYGRGPSRSRPIKDVAGRVGALVAQGRKEVVMTGVDLTSWGGDLEGTPTLGRLVREILAAQPELARLRLSSLDCAEADPELWAAFAEEERLMPHLHLSLQSGSDLILKRMKRRHTRADAVRFCQRALRVRPNMALGADMIVGFPTETEAMFSETLALVDECRLSFLHVFPYSSRLGTPAARMPQVASEVIGDRAARLRAKGEEILARRLDAQLGRTLRVLVENGGRGHAEDFTLVRTPPSAKRGDIVDVVITGRSGRELMSALPSSRSVAGGPSYAPAPAP